MVEIGGMSGRSVGEHCQRGLERVGEIARVAARFSRERSLDRLEALLDGAAGSEA